MTRLVVARNLLLPALAAAGKAADKKNTIPILNNVLLDSDGETLKLVGTNLDQEITATAQLISGDAMKSTLPAQLLHDAVKALPESAEVGIDLDRTHATVFSGKTKIRMPVLPATDFPSISQSNLTHSFEIDAAELQEMLSAVRQSVSSEETRIYLNGIYLHDDGAGRLVAVATDGHRLSRWMRDLPEGAEGMPGIILPRQALNLVAAMVGDKGAVTVSLSDTKVLLRTQAGSLLTKLVDGTYPDYQRIVPTGNPHVYRVKRAALSAAMARVGIVESVRGSAVRFGFAREGVVTLLSNGEDRSATDEVACETEASIAVDIGLSGRYIAEMLSAAVGEEVEFALLDNMSPTLITPVGSGRQVFVIMPMRV